MRRRRTGVHQARVTCRRLRAALGTFRPLLDPDVTGPVRDEIRWLGRALGDARDAEVVHERLRAWSTPDGERGRPGAAPDGETLRAGPSRRTRTSAETIAFPRYSDLLGRLGRLVAARRGPGCKAEVCRAGPSCVRRGYARLATDEAAGPAVAAAGVGHDVAVTKCARRPSGCATPRGRRTPSGTTTRPGWRRRRRGSPRHLGERQDTVISRRVMLGLAASAAACRGEHRDLRPARGGRRSSAPARVRSCLRPGVARCSRTEAVGLAASERRQSAWDTLDMLKSGMRSPGVAVREK